jgi:hypothetical protein
MENTRRLTAGLILAIAFCFLLVSPGEADAVDPANVGENVPLWNIAQGGTAISIRWVDHTPNPRFAIHDAGTSTNLSDDLVLDKETRLIWARNANLPKGMQTWQDAMNYCRNQIQLGNRKAWRLPTIEELLSLIDPSQSNPALPNGHPFVNVQGVFYWSSTTYESSSSRAWFVSMGVGFAQVYSKSVSYFAWPVRGGNGYASGRW